ncbi:MAG: crossover junction endodeoxyribonuclease RuvC [Pseudomonadota bacterium]
MRIIGIDPGLRRLGWGVIESQAGRLRHIESGVISPATPERDLALRLHDLHIALSDIVERFAPNCAAIEATFVNKNGAATLKLGQARGVALLVPAQFGLPVAEYAPNAVKKAVVGVGHADKRQVGHMVRLQLPGAAPQGADAADALAIALCHAMHARGGDKLSQAIAAAQ